MSKDQELIDEYLISLADRYTASELVELLGLDIWAILDNFEEEILNHKDLRNSDRE